MTDRYARLDSTANTARSAAEVAWLTLFAERMYGHAAETVDGFRVAFVASFLRGALPARAAEFPVPREASAWIIHVGARHGAIWARRGATI